MRMLQTSSTTSRRCQKTVFVGQIWNNSLHEEAPILIDRDISVDDLMFHEEFLELSILPPSNIDFSPGEKMHVYI
jgi:hypothetical protein